MADIDFNYFLAQKYSQLQQQADATTANAASSGIAARAAASLDQARAGVVGPESVANIAQTRAQTNLIGQQAQVVVPESRARIANLGAETALSGTNNLIARREGLTPRPILPSSLQAIMGNRYRLGGLYGDPVQ